MVTKCPPTHTGISEKENAVNKKIVSPQYPRTWIATDNNELNVLCIHLCTVRPP